MGLSSSLQAQLTNNGANIRIMPGGYLFATSTINNASGTITNDGNIEVQGDFTNAATYTNSTANDYLVFSGNSLATFKTGGSSFTNITIDKSSNPVKLGDNLLINGNLTMQSGNLELNHFNIDLGSGTGQIVNETNDSRITGTAGGTIMKTANLNAPSSVNPGNIGIEISSSQNLGNTVIKRGHVQQTGNGGISIYRYFDITPANNASLNATLKMYYFDNELSGLDESKLQFYKSDDNGATWTSIGKDNNDATADFVTKNSIPSLSSWTLYEAGALPVKLIAFSARIINRQTHLQWSTAQEINSDFYDVERSENGGLFDNMLSVKAKGNTGIRSDYAAIDPNPFPLTYYRLKEVDRDGNYSYSPVIHVSMDGDMSYMVHPNPASGVFYLEISSSKIQRSVIGLFDDAGKLLERKTVELIPGNNKISWDISRMAKGTYFLRSADNGMPVIKVVKQ